MPVNSFADLRDIHKSVLQEIGNLGAGNAASSVSQMISAPTDISTPQVKIVSPALAGKIADTLSKDAVTYLIHLRLDVLGSLLFIFPYPFIQRLAGSFFPDVQISGPEGIDIMTTSLISETVNLSAAAYANSISTVTELTVDISTPKAVKAPSDAIFSGVEAVGSSVCTVSNTIEILDCHKGYTALFYPEFNSVKKILDTMGMV